MAQNHSSPSGAVSTPTVIELAIQSKEENEQTTPEFNQKGNCYGFTEIGNLVWAKKDPVMSVALEEWDRTERLLSARLERREKRRVDLINQIFNLVGFYSVFQGVVLTAVSQLASNLNSQCGKVWSPVVLSVVAAAVTLRGLLLKFTDLRDLEFNIIVEKRAQAEVLYRRQRLLERGEAFQFYKPRAEPEVPNSKPIGKSTISVLVSLIFVTGLFVISYFVFLCDLWEIKSLRKGL